MSGSLLTKFIFPKIEFKFGKNLFNKKNLKAFAIQSIFPIIIGSALLILMLILDKTDNATSQNVDKIIQDLKTKEKQDQLLKDFQKKQEIINILQEYFEAYSEKNIERIDSFYIFPLEKFYTYQNLPKKDVEERVRFYFNCNPTVSMFNVNLQNTEVVFKGKDTVQVSIKMNENDNRTIYTKIKMNGSKKIFSIGNTIMTNYYPDEDLNTKPIKNKNSK